MTLVTRNNRFLGFTEDTRKKAKRSNQELRKSDLEIKCKCQHY